MSKRQSTDLARGSSLSIAYARIDQLKPDPKNVRLHTAKQIQQIAQSIEAFGFNVPILVDAEGNVIAGHGRLLACKRLGWSEVPTIRLEHLSESQRRAFMIADNRLTEIASWDDRLLAEQLQALSSVELDFDIETIGSTWARSICASSPLARKRRAPRSSQSSTSQGRRSAASAIFGSSGGTSSSVATLEVRLRMPS
jgi:hypothetical protein